MPANEPDTSATTSLDLLAAGALLSRQDLIRRWQHGSQSFFWRAAEDGLLMPSRAGATPLYSWADVFAFEGGPPPDGLERAYRHDLLTPEQVAPLSPWKPETIVSHARRGHLVHRKIGRVYRFVPAEVAAWLAHWRAGTGQHRRVPAKSRKNSPVTPDDSNGG